MNTSVAIPIATAILATVVVMVAYFLLKRQVARERAAIRSEADRVLAEATKASEARLRESAIEAKEKVLAAQLEFDKTVQARRLEIASLEKRIVQKEENLDRKIEKLLARLGTLEQENERLKAEVTAARRSEKDAADSKGAVERLEKDHETVRERLEKLVATLEAAEKKA